VGKRFSTPIQTAPGAHPASYAMSTRSSRGYSGWGVALATHPNLVPRLKKEKRNSSMPTILPP